MTLSPTRRALIGMIGAAAAFRARRGRAQASPLEITIAGGTFKPIPVAIAPFLGADARAQKAGADIAEVVAANMTNSGLFRLIPPGAQIERIANFDAAPRFADWRAIGAEALLLGRAARRRAAHKVSDAVYSALTGESGYFDSRIAFVDESGPKGARVKRLGLMDQDGANVRMLTDGRHLALTPRFSPVDQTVIYLSYESGKPQVHLLNIDTGQREALGGLGAMSFAPRFSPDGRRIALSVVDGGDTDIFLMDLASRRLTRLTGGPAIETAPSFSPDGSRIVFESDRGGGPQLYVVSAAGGGAQRISFGQGRYGTPVWSPRGDLIAFTRQGGGRFDIGVMRPDGSGERILDSSFHSEGPTWSPNGRVVAFFRETAGQGGTAGLWSVDAAGINTRRLATPRAASDPAWSPLLP